ncbi:MAG TPA: PAS domain-containing protein [Candidatus Baltobacteraceae bacterium]|jgi:PAS domain S-box-containing protein|nr:PAS domain-containing protein [Candidatus Baltobacteraceae bacterium]
MGSHPASSGETHSSSQRYSSEIHSSKPAASNSNGSKHIVPGGADISFTLTHCKFEDLFCALHEFMLVLNPHGEIEVVWSSNASLPVQVKTALLGRKAQDVLDAQSCAQLLEWLDRGGTGSYLEEVEYPARFPDGLHWFALRVMPVAHAAGGLTGFCLFGRDITEKRKYYDSLRKDEALLRKAEEIGRMGCWEVNLETGEGTWSDSLYRLLGQDPKGPLMNRERFLALTHPDDVERVKKLPGLASWTGEYQEHEARFVLPDGRVRTFFTRAVPIGLPDGRITSVVGLSEDVTERKEVQQRLQRSEVLLAGAERLANLGSWEYEVSSKTLTWSAQFYRMLGFDPRSEAKPMPRDEKHRVIHPDDLAEAVRDLDEIETTGKPLENELRFVTAKGEVRIFHSRAVAIKDESGRVTCIRGMSQDITERRREEERVRRSETLLAQAERIANLGSWEFDLKTEKTRLSKSLLRLYGIDCDADFTRDWYWECVHPADRRRARILENRGWRNGKPYVYMVRFRRPNGRTRVHFVRGVPILGAGKRTIGSVGVVQDITDQRRVVQDLRRLSQEVMRTRDQERRQTARVLHESAGQSLAALKMTLNRLKGAVARNEEGTQDLWRTAIELTEAAAREVRTVSYLMHPPLLDESGLGAALRWYATGFTDRSGIDVVLDLDDHLGRQSQEIETTLFRMVQEALTNVHRYSGSRKAWIHVKNANRKICVEVRDEGRGLKVDKTSTKAVPLGVGIAGMRERVEQLGGIFEIESAPGRGTLLRATLPAGKRGENPIPEPDESEGLDAKQQRRKTKHAKP